MNNAQYVGEHAAMKHGTISHRGVDAWSATVIEVVYKIDADVHTLGGEWFKRCAL